MSLRLSKCFGAFLRSQQFVRQGRYLSATSHESNKTSQHKPSTLSQPVTTNSNEKNTDADREVAHHSKYANDWWNRDGVMRALHSLNTIRVPFIRDGLVARGSVEKAFVNTTKVLQKQRILEVGCGGGLLTEQLARLGATVTAIDLGEDLISAATKHLETESSELRERITYKVEPVEIHVKANLEFYDAVVVSEVIEHVDNKVPFLTACVQALKPGGSIFITTPNKTLPMWVGGILLGENVLSIAPRGTHHWDKLISPLDMQRILDTLNCETVLVNGSTYDFWRNTWRWINSTSFCYALQAIKTC